MDIRITPSQALLMFSSVSEMKQVWYLNLDLCCLSFLPLCWSCTVFSTNNVYTL